MLVLPAALAAQQGMPQVQGHPSALFAVPGHTVARGPQAAARAVQGRILMLVLPAAPPAQQGMPLAQGRLRVHCVARAMRLVQGRLRVHFAVAAMHREQGHLRAPCVPRGAMLQLGHPCARVAQWLTTAQLPPPPPPPAPVAPLGC